MQQMSSSTLVSPDEVASGSDVQDLARLGHDVRGPSGVVLGALTELERTLGEGPHSTFVAMAKRGARRLLRLADRYSITADLAAGTKPTLSSVDLGLVARGAIRDASAVHAPRALEIDVAGLEVAPTMVYAYPSWVSSAIGDALMLLLLTAPTRLGARVEVNHDGGASVTVWTDGDISTITPAWIAARETTGRPGLEAQQLAAHLVQRVMAVHGGEARLEVIQDPQGTHGIVLAFPATPEPLSP